MFVPLIAKQDGATVQGNDLAAAEQDVIDAAQNAVPSDLEVLPAGPGGLLVAFIDAFEGLDSTLLGVALLVVILILLVVYRRRSCGSSRCSRPCSRWGCRRW